MEKLYQILADCCPEIDFKTENSLVSGEILDSIDLISIISDIEEGFDVSIDMEEVTPENFDSAEAIWQLIQRIK